MSYSGLYKVISGGQTGADQAGLIAAYKLNVLTGGVAPANFITDRGPNPLLQLLNLEAKGTYKSRTIENLKNSDGTILLAEDLNSPGTALTKRMCVQYNKLVLEIDLSPFVAEYRAGSLGSTESCSIAMTAEPIAEWIIANQIAVLNVAGNRERYDDLLITRLSTIFIDLALKQLNLQDYLITKSNF